MGEGVAVKLPQHTVFLEGMRLPDKGTARQFTLHSCASSAEFRHLTDILDHKYIIKDIETETSLLNDFLHNEHLLATLSRLRLHRGCTGAVVKQSKLTCSLRRCGQ